MFVLKDRFRQFKYFRKVSPPYAKRFFQLRQLNSLPNLNKCRKLSLRYDIKGWTQRAKACKQNSTSTILHRLGYSRVKRMSSSSEIAYLSSSGSNNESSADESDHSIHLMTSQRKDNFLHLFNSWIGFFCSFAAINSHISLEIYWNFKFKGINYILPSYDKFKGINYILPSYEGNM